MDKLSKPLEDFTKVLNEVAEKIHKENNVLTGRKLAEAVLKEINENYLFYIDVAKVKQVTEKEEVVLATGEKATVNKLVDKQEIKREYKTIVQILSKNSSLDLYAPIERLIDESSFERQPLEHNEDEQLFIKNVAKLFYNTDAYSVGTTLTNFRIFCQNIHKNLNTPNSEMADNICLYQYSAIGGTGKSQLSKIAIEALKRLGYEAANAEIRGRWVGNEFSRLIVAVKDEFMPPKGENKEEFIEKFNPIVSNDYYPVEYKGRDKYFVKSVSSLIINSNFLPFDTNTRRYGIITYNDFNIIKDNRKPEFEDMVEAFITCLKTVPFNKRWNNPVKTVDTKTSELVWMARDVLNDNIDHLTLKDCTIRQFVKSYIALTNSSIKPLALQRDVFQTIIENNIKPSHRINGNLLYSKYDFEAIADMETNEDEQESNLDNYTDCIERTEAAFKMYITDETPTGPKPLRDETESTDETDKDNSMNNKTWIEQAVDIAWNLGIILDPSKDMDMIELIAAGWDLNTNEENTTLTPINEAYTVKDALMNRTPLCDNKFSKPTFKTEGEFLVSAEWTTEALVEINNKTIEPDRKSEHMRPVFFVYESDDLSKEEQLKYINKAVKEHKNSIYSVTDSGHKSYHVLVKIKKEYRDVVKNHFKYFWKKVANSIFDEEFVNHLDEACASVARLTRRPGGIREDGSKQTCYYINKQNEGIIINKGWIEETEAAEKQLAEINKQNEEVRKILNAMYGESNISEEQTLNNFYKANPEKWEVAKQLVECEDPGSGSNMIGAISQLKTAGLNELAAIAQENAHYFHPSNITKSI